ncbi:Coenzyme F420 hydrogenase/dehydrogenase, beta subunit C-terminal domain [Bacillus cereus]|uniref:Coenzyme F420 hydrogenase/dehydrogenase, beta subunit C-terminal domain n=1 Tax=Bacillus cereus TaxID=1396 RepID=UPI00227EA5BF|nr:Coenzyme F420 hydrogenase/dehydrogenase, beta subunit C-terminal domain [Bacillus cereus]
MSFLTLQTDIINEELCTSCGLCVSACPKDLIRLDNNSVPLPYFTDSLNVANDICQECNICSKVCPGYDTGSIKSDQRLFGRERSEEERWIGIYKNSYQLSTKDEAVLQKVAAGGAGTTLGIVALKENLVDAMLVVGRDEERPWVPKAFLTNSIEKVIECAQSSYCITPNLHLLKDTEFKRIGIVGVPCQIQGIQKLLNEKNDPLLKNLASKIVFTIELGCASSTSLAGTEHLITELLGIDLNDVETMKYREGTYPGEFMVRTYDKTEHFLPFYRLVEEFKKFKTFRCLTCPDWWSGIADISISDGDPNIFDTSFNGEKPKPSSTTIVRTEFGSQLINLAKEKGYIDLWEYKFTNNLGLERKRQRYRYYQTKTDKKIPVSSGMDENFEVILSDDEVIKRGIKDTAKN